MQKAPGNAFYSILWLLLHTKQATISVLSCSVLVCSDRDGITVLGKAHMRSAPSSRSFFTVAPETVPMLIGLVINGSYTTPLVMMVMVIAVINGLHYALSTALGHLRAEAGFSLGHGIRKPTKKKWPFLFISLAQNGGRIFYMRV